MYAIHVECVHIAAVWSLHGKKWWPMQVEAHGLERAAVSDPHPAPVVPEQLRSTNTDTLKRIHIHSAQEEAALTGWKHANKESSRLASRTSVCPPGPKDWLLLACWCFLPQSRHEHKASPESAKALHVSDAVVTPPLGVRSSPRHSSAFSPVSWISNGAGASQNMNMDKRSDRGFHSMFDSSSWRQDPALSGGSTFAPEQAHVTRHPTGVHAILARLSA